MNGRTFLISILLVLFSLSLFAQTDRDDVLEAAIRQIEDLDISSTAKEEWIEQLSAFLISPLNLNSAEEFQLRLLGLDDFQIFSLQHYIKETGELFSLHELNLINGFDDETLIRIKPFVCIRKSEWKASLRLDSIAKHNSQELRLQYKQTIERAKGYARDDGKGYLGNPFAAQFRYNFNYFDRLQFSVVADKDAGEPFFNSLQPYGFDHYSIQLTLKHICFIKQLTLGDYRLAFGEGLAVSQGFSLSYLNTDAVIRKRNYGITPHRSSAEYDYNHGIATQIDIGKTSLFLFASIDKSDYSGNLLTTGLHRTEHELATKDSTLTRMLGTHLAYDRKGLQLGATAIYYDFKDSLHHQNRQYQKYYFEGKRNSVLSLNASYLFKRLNLFGEAALSRNKAYAALFGVQINLAYKTTLSCSYRNYDKKFQNHYATALSAQSRIANEQAVNFALAHRINDKYSYYIGCDFFHFPFATYISTPPTKGCKLKTEFLFTPDERTKVRLISRITTREQDNKSEPGTLQSKTTLQTQIHALYSINEHFQLHFRTGYNTSRFTNTANGWFLCMEAIMKLPHPKLQLNFRYTYFDTDNYDTRFTLYEYNLPLTYSSAMLYDRGHRAYIFLRCNLHKRMQLSFRYSVSLYTDKETISSGNDQIPTNHKQDIGIQLYFKF